MKSAGWKDIAELAGIAAIVASLIFVGLQMRQDQEIAITDTFASTIESVGTLASLIGENPEIWKNGLDGEELSFADELKFLAMVETVETHFFNLFLRFNRLEIADPATVARDYAYAIYIHPGLHKAYQESKKHNEAEADAWNTSAVNGPLVQSVDSLLDEIDKSAPSIPSNKDYIFW